MMALPDIQLTLQKLLSPSRYAHCARVAAMSKRLADKWKLNSELAELAGWVHDCAKPLNPEQLDQMGIDRPEGSDATFEHFPAIWHSHVGPAVANSVFEITDPDILAAIRTHTTGLPGMSPFSLAIFVADYCEPARTFPIRGFVEEVAFTQGLLEAAYVVVVATIHHLLQTGRPIHPDTIQFREWVLSELDAQHRHRLDLALWPHLS